MFKTIYTNSVCHFVSKRTGNVISGTGFKVFLTNNTRRLEHGLIANTHRPLGAEGECTSFTANKNWIAQTNRQQRFNDNVNAHRANVTS